MMISYLNFVLIVYFSKWGAFVDLFYEGVALVVQLVLGIASFGIQKMEIIVVAACEDIAAVGGGWNEEVVIDSLVLDHFA